MSLSHEKCQPQKGAQALTEQASQALLQEVPGWTLEASQLKRRFSFDSYWAGLGFVNAVAWIAQSQQHHPEIHLGYKTVDLQFSTHDVKGLSRNDFICAAKANALLP